MQAYLSQSTSVIPSCHVPNGHTRCISPNLHQLWSLKMSEKKVIFLRRFTVSSTELASSLSFFRNLCTFSTNFFCLYILPLDMPVVLYCNLLFVFFFCFFTVRVRLWNMIIIKATNLSSKLLYHYWLKPIYIDTIKNIFF